MMGINVALVMGSSITMSGHKYEQWLSKDTTLTLTFHNCYWILNLWPQDIRPKDRRQVLDGHFVHP